MKPLRLGWYTASGKQMRWLELNKGHWALICGIGEHPRGLRHWIVVKQGPDGLIVTLCEHRFPVCRLDVDDPDFDICVVCDSLVDAAAKQRPRRAA